MKRRLLYGFGGLILISLVAGGMWLFLSFQVPREFVQKTADISSFKPYYPSDRSFKLVANSVSSGGGVLLFSVTNKNGKSIAVTEQSTPDGFDTSTLKGDAEYDIATGHVFITDGQSRTTGTIFTKDKTWVLINAPDPIGKDEMQSFIASLKLTR